MVLFNTPGAAAADAGFLAHSSSMWNRHRPAPAPGAWSLSDRKPRGVSLGHGIDNGNRHHEQRKWLGELLGDSVIASAVLDRLLHHSHVLNIRGESYRLREKRQAGLFPSQQHISAAPEEAGDNYAH